MYTCGLSLTLESKAGIKLKKKLKTVEVTKYETQLRYQAVYQVNSMLQEIN
jgi:hypothetical protein